MLIMEEIPVSAIIVFATGLFLNFFIYAEYPMELLSLTIQPLHAFDSAIIVHFSSIVVVFSTLNVFSLLHL